jgi:hypothetical protein
MEAALAPSSASEVTMRLGQPSLRFIVRLALVVGLALAIIGCELLVELDETDLLPIPDAGAGTGILPQNCSICTDAPFLDAPGPSDAEVDAAPDAERGEAESPDTGARDTGPPDSTARDGQPPESGPGDTGAKKD